MSNVRISQLNDFSTIRPEDFVPLVDSSSLTTYKTTVQSVMDFLSDSGSVATASYVLSASYAKSSSRSDRTILSDSSSFLVFPNSSTASYTLNASSSRTSVSSSFSTFAMTAVSASYVNFTLPSSTPPFALTANSSSWASASISASFATNGYNSRSSSWASASISASYSLSSSFAKNTTFADSSSYINDDAVRRLSAGKSYQVANPGAAFSDGTHLYVYSRCRNGGDARILVKIHMTTNVVTFLKQWPVQAWDVKPRVFRSTVDNQPHVLMWSNKSVIYDYNLTTDVLISTSIGSTAYPFNNAIYADFTVPTKPIVYSLVSGFAPENPGNTPTHPLRRLTWSGNNAVISNNVGTNINLKNINNHDELDVFYNYATKSDTVTSTLSWDYNYLKKRYYLVDTNTGYLHILSQTTGQPYDGSNWLSTSITYVKTLAIPTPHLSTWSDNSTESIFIDWDIDTGNERGIIFVRRGNQTLTGAVTYVNWPE